jgi:hypothetical protein
MPVEIPNLFAQVTVKLQHVSGSHVGAVVFGIADTDGLTDAIATADKVTQNYLDTWGVVTDLGVAIGPTIIQVGVGSGPPVSFVGSLTGTGTITGNVLPSNCALLVAKQTLTGGRRGRGRMFIPWVNDESNVDDVGIISSGSLSALQTAADDFLTALADPGPSSDATPMFLLHNTEGETPAGPPSEVISLQCSQLIATQRRRLGR